MLQINKSSALSTVPRLAELDGLRGVAVAIVLIWHFVGASLPSRHGFAFKALYDVTILGRTGVDLFFVLSGFLIIGIILDRQQSPLLFLKNFYIRRFLRIAPSYILLVVIFWAAVYTGAKGAVFNADTPLWRHLTFTQNLWMAAHNKWGPDGISVTWSVAIEEQFYLVFPLMILLLPRRILLPMLGAVAVASITYRAVGYFGFGSVFTMYVHTLSRLDGLAEGGIIAVLWRDDRFRGWLRQNIVIWSKLTKALAFGFIPLMIGMAHDVASTTASWGHTYLTLFYGSVLVHILGSLGSQNVSWLRKGSLRKLGRTSYTLYLFHPLILSATYIAAGRPEVLDSPTAVLLSLLALGLSVIWSYASFRFFERPLTDYGRRWSY
ncbi:peptidoglycan/LPS O-acetylase OafA/YrhL [Rhizobium sp. BK650]|uniref:acyltransferase family protein n=1 Tax=Rhizobium sp. BK650 TaxID=2586990 RepID=UPI0016209042|nr:acyltransferase [Rhizobium sp. BK650]MBB3659771.1 peptidoglycan/LPS O-acetylase OafA/YrhL [Rhizobium sp. BK650]